MNREEYMRRLEEALTDITPFEKEEAIQYYNDYFDDAGVENEEEVMNSLGTPTNPIGGSKKGFCIMQQRILKNKK